MKLFMNDQRQIKRFSLNLQTTVCSDLDKTQQKFSCITKDISSIGAFLHTSRQFDAGSVLSLQFDIPHMLGTSFTTYLATIGTVLRSSSDGLAIRFNKSCQIKPSHEGLSKTFNWLECNNFFSSKKQVC